MASKEILIVDWEDITTNDSWHKPDLDHAPLRCQSVGVLQEETKKYLVLHSMCADHANGYQSISNTTTIPKGCITRIRTIKRKGIL